MHATQFQDSRLYTRNGCEDETHQDPESKNFRDSRVIRKAKYIKPTFQTLYLPFRELPESPSRFA